MQNPRELIERARRVADSDLTDHLGLNLAKTKVLRNVTRELADALELALSRLEKAEEWLKEHDRSNYGSYITERDLREAFRESLEGGKP